MANMNLEKTVLNPDRDIQLRVPKESDLIKLATSIFEPENFELIVTFTGYTTDITTPKIYLDKKLKPRLKETKEGCELLLFIYYKGQLAGRISAHEIDYKTKKTEIGYLLLKEFRGKGIITRCASELERFLFEDLDINRIELTVDPKNLPSIAIAKKLGYTHEGTLRESYFNEYLGEYRDDQIWSTLKSDFKLSES